MTDFLLMYEHRARELDNVCLLAAELERRGHSVGVLNRFDYKNHNRYLFKRKPKVVCTVACYGDASPFAQAQQFAGNVKKIVNFRWEQVFSQSVEDNLENSFAFPKGKSKDVVHLCWGELPQTQLRSCGVRHPVLTGPIHMDFLSPQLRFVYLPREQVLEEFGIRTPKVLLYISSFSYASFDDEQVRRFERQTGYPYMESSKQERKLRGETLRWFERLLEENKDLTVVYRPHPAEIGSAPVSELASRNDRFKIISNYSVKQWILISDQIATWVSTAAVEAYFAGKNIAIVRPYDTPEVKNPVVYKGCRECNTYEQFKFELENGDKLDCPINEALIKKYYDEDFSKLSYTRIADVLEEISENDQYDYHEKDFSYVRVYKTAAAAVMKTFLYNSSVYSCHLLLISSASVKSIPFLSFTVPIFA